LTKQMPSVVNQPLPVTYKFSDDGSIPNNPAWPLVLYRAGIHLSGSPDPEDLIEKTFAGNGWGNMWRNGIYPYTHYHSMIHEAMAIARGRAKVRFGGDNGEDIDIGPGDVVILPAGTGHQCLMQTPTLVVIGAYPPDGKYNICRGSKAEHETAVLTIPTVPPPTVDPVFGPGGPLMTLWRPQSAANVA
jgi:uncharacterized protein YjlB